jgi:outer membrane murein-binding lipoprotein Lpp
MMIEYPSALSPLSTSSASASSNQKQRTSKTKEWTALQTKLWDAQKLARVILGREAKEMTSSEVLEAIRAFAEMKQELELLRRQSTWMKKMVVATKSSQAALKRVVERRRRRSSEEKTSCTKVTAVETLKESGKDKESTQDAVMEEDEEEAVDGRNDTSSSSSRNESPLEDATITTTTKDSKDEDRDTRVVVKPSKSQSWGVGVIADLEDKIIKWQATFAQLNQDHETQLIKCQADLDRVSMSLDSMGESTRQISPEQADQARAELDRLVAIVSAFPSKSRLEELERDVTACRKSEQQAKMDLARALQELEDIRNDERNHHPLQRSFQDHGPTKKSSSDRLYRYSKKKIQKLFRLDHRNSSATASTLNQ